MRDHGDEVTVLDKLTYAGRRENLPRCLGRPVRPRRDRGPGRNRRRRRRLRGDRQLRGRDARGSVDQPGRRSSAITNMLGHARAARGGPRTRPALRPGVDRRGLRLDRVRLVHGDLAAAAVQPLQRDQDGRRPARRLSYFHTYGLHDLDLPRLEQLRSPPVPREADPADDPQRARRRLACRCTATAERAQLAVRGGLRARNRRRCWSTARPGEAYNCGGPDEMREHRRRAADPVALPAPTNR